MKLFKRSEKRLTGKTKSRLRENIEAIALAVILALFIRTFVVQAFKIPSGSMKQTLLIGDHILVSKFIYGVKLPVIGKTLIPFSEPKQGDIIVFKFPEDPEKDFIKRVVAVSGDVVEIRDKKVFINGKMQQYPYGYHTDPVIIPGGNQPRDNFGPITVPPDALFVLGDNRDHSYDSRFWGYVNLSAVKGKAFIIYWSWNKEDFGVRWTRIGKFLK
ncbi:MAG TPA: signal peptidase I [Deltaproteobacteria bacterium]|nr:signal peptidase I [Deltaproteobacteria bacterium]